MKFNIYTITLAGLLCMNSTCGSTDENGNGNNGASMQKEWTNDMRITASYGGGMIDESRNVQVTADSAIYELRENGMEGKYAIKFSKTELDALAKVFYDNDFVNIKSTQREGTIYDAPSASVMYCTGANCTTKGDDAYSVYTGENATRIKNVSGYLWKICDQKLDEHKVDLQVMIDEALLKEKDEIQYQVSPGTISYNTTMGRHDKQQYKVLPGSISVAAYTMTKDSMGYTRYPLNTNAVFSMKEGNTVLISKKNGNLQLEFKKL